MKSSSNTIYLSLLLIILFSYKSYASKVDTIETYSNLMQKKIKAVVITPIQYDNVKKLPVVYLLHGFGGNYSDWVNKVPVIKELADEHGFIIVCPDGNISSWYFDSPVKAESKYETYISKELTNWIDDHYTTIKNRSGRAITGLSMGGHGALYVSFKHQDVFGAAGSTSGGVDIRPFPLNWKMAEQLGSYAEKPENWEKNTVINMVNLLIPKRMALVIDCGTEDFFYKVNVNLHELLMERNIPHDFISSPGNHSFSYWVNSIKYQLLFFNDYFDSNNK